MHILQAVAKLRRHGNREIIRVWQRQLERGPGVAGVAADKNVIPKYVSAQATEISKQELNTPQAAKEKCQLNIIKYIPFD